MELHFNGILYALSYALDCEERELVGVAEGHAKWVAYISACMGEALGFSVEEKMDLAACAALHDNALTQYVAEEVKVKKVSHSEAEYQTFLLQDTKRQITQLTSNHNLGRHCVVGEENVKNFPFHTDVTGIILYHHENANGTGTFGKKESETPLFAQIIHFADYMDASIRFKDISNEKYDRITHILENQKNKLFSEKIVKAFYQAMPRDRYLSLAGKDIDDLLWDEVPDESQNYSFEQVKAIIDVFAKIIDYKSTFTRNHSIQIAEKVYQMGEFYHYDKETCERLYMAGSLHDIGKMAINNDVLEKPDKLSDQEFAYMQNHAWYTYEILSKIKGFEDITRWAALHHEKLNGKGYPFGKTAEQLGEKERLMGCIDIYQALSEDRPYKPGMDHEKCISIMKDMASQGFIDGKITEDVNQVFK